MTLKVVIAVFSDRLLLALLLLPEHSHSTGWSMGFAKM
jgi:hypothetical protein